MFSTIAIISSLAILAAATPMPNDTPASSCTTGPVQCCQSTTTAGAPAAAGILAGLGVVIQDLSTPVGLTCSPITGIGLSGSDCAAQPVCCTNDSFNGLIAIGCTPVNINA